MQVLHVTICTNLKSQTEFGNTVSFRARLLTDSLCVCWPFLFHKTNKPTHNTQHTNESKSFCCRARAKKQKKTKKNLRPEKRRKNNAACGVGPGNWLQSRPRLGPCLWSSVFSVFQCCSLESPSLRSPSLLLASLLDPGFWP